MMSMSESPATCLVTLVAVTHFWFRQFEPRSYTTAVVALFVPPTIFAFSLVGYLSSPLVAILAAYPLFYTSLLTSIVVYRLSPFHPLARYPGPILARTTKIWTVLRSLDGKLPEYYQRLHDQYGSIVRIGPNEVSVVDKNLIPYILGTQGMPKGPLWEGRRITPSKDKGNYSLIGQRDSNRHAQLRKAWNRAFAAEPILDYKEFLTKRANELVDRLNETCKKSPSGSSKVDVAKWISYFSFDLMGDLALGGGFDLLLCGDKDGYQASMEEGLLIPSLTQQIPWLAHLMQLFPVFSASTRAFGAFAVERAKIRASKAITEKDLFYHLVNNTFSNDDASPFPLIVSNAVLAIIAGSDTTASVLSNIVYYLVSNPSSLEKLKQELDQAFPPLRDGSVVIEMESLTDLPWLNAVINETLRLQPPVPTGLQRAPERGTGGKMVGEHFFKEGTAVQVPPYVLHRDPRYFSPDPEKFWPERWIQHENDPNIVLDTSAFIPFSIGPANCAGKRLAILELRYVTALLISRFEMSFAPDWDTRKWEENLKDRFVLAKGELMVELDPRKV